MSYVHISICRSVPYSSVVCKFVSAICTCSNILFVILLSFYCPMLPIFYCGPNFLLAIHCIIIVSLLVLQPRLIVSFNVFTCFYVSSVVFLCFTVPVQVFWLFYPDSEIFENFNVIVPILIKSLYLHFLATCLPFKALWISSLLSYRE